MESLKTTETQSSFQSDQDLSQLTEMLSSTTLISQTGLNATETEYDIFVVINEGERDEIEAAESHDDSQEQDEEFDNDQSQEDPIASDDFEDIPMEDDQSGDEEQGASEELCIIPDTNRVISQEEIDAASSMRLGTKPTKNKDNGSKESSPGTSGQTEVNDSLVTKYMTTLNTDQSGSKTVRVKNLGTNIYNTVAQIEYVRECAYCFKEIMNDDMNLSWEIMEFCNKTCLSKYQKKIGSNCADCNGKVKPNCVGKYCVRFGYDIRQFCNSVCLEEYKKGRKTCAYCQKDMSSGDGFLAPVGDKTQFREFCTKICMERYDRASNNKTPEAEKCSVCKKKNPVSIEFEFNNKMNLFCGEPCFVAFKFVNNIVPGKCDMCRKYFDNEVLEQNSIFCDDAQHSFCSNTCQNTYIIDKRQIVKCSWCKVKKYNFDMIKNLGTPVGPLSCSLNCYNMLQLAAETRTICDQCSKNSVRMYGLNMSDATIRNFCSRICVVTFQKHFPQSLADTSIPVPVGKPRRSKPTKCGSSSNSNMPVIVSVHSLAMADGSTSNITTRGAKKNVDSVINSSEPTKTPIKQQVIIMPAPVPTQKNMATMCKIRQSNKSVSVKPVMVDKEVQTDDLKDKTVVIPIPVPIYAPTPTCMYSLPFPKPFPFPLPIPVPIFIPTTRKSAAGIMKEIEKIQVQTPADPLEAELLQIAEMIAEDNIEENIDSELSQVAEMVAEDNIEKNSASELSQMVKMVAEDNIEKNSDSELPQMAKMVAEDNIEENRDSELSQVAEMVAEDNIEENIDSELSQVAEMVAEDNIEENRDSELSQVAEMVAEDNIEENRDSELSQVAEKVAEDIIEEISDSELSHIAEMVAEDNIEEIIDSESDQQDSTPAPPEDVPFNPEPIEPSNTFEEDILKMASKWDEPITITASETESTDEAVDDPQPMHDLMERQPERGRKRRGRPRRHGPVSKRGRRSSSQFDIPLMSPPQSLQPAEPVEKPDAQNSLICTFGVNAWKQWVTTRNAKVEMLPRWVKSIKPDILQLTAYELNYSLCLFVKEARKPDGVEYAPDTIYYLCLGIQQYLFDNGRIDNIFWDVYYEEFTDCLDDIARKFIVLYNDAQYIVTRVEEEYLWESRQLGAHSPHVLLNTLMFFNTKYFHFTSIDEHLQMSFFHMIKYYKKNLYHPWGRSKVGLGSLHLRFFPPKTSTQMDISLGAPTREEKVYEQPQNHENPLRCPVKLYDFFLSKCPESVKVRTDIFYLLPERACTPDSPVWYSTEPLPRNALKKMYNRVKMVKEINVSLFI